jgi:glucokinase
MATFPECVLLGDIGGTNARLALATESVLGPVTSFEVNRFARFTDVVDLFLRDDRHRSRLRHAFFAIAAPIHSERCELTNSAWVIDAIELQATSCLRSQLFNDSAAVAHSLPLLGPADLAKIGGGADDKTSPMAVLGPGTGLGVACLIRQADKPVVIASEGGHATLTATCDLEDQIIERLRQRFGDQSAMVLLGRWMSTFSQWVRRTRAEGSGGASSF